MLLAGCVIPFSIAQVGLLTYALPLYMDAHGAGSASVGRILMLYGFCVIYFGPWMGRVADRSAYKKNWIVLGGLVGSVRSEEHTSELQSLMRISYAVFCLKKKNKETPHVHKCSN